MKKDKKKIDFLVEIYSLIGKHSEKISGLMNDYGLDLSNIEIGGSDKLFDYLGVPKDNSQTTSSDSDDFWCRDGFYEGLFSCGSDKTMLFEFISELNELYSKPH